jgi:hypothetical protein
VSDDPIALLERELVGAARRRAAAVPVPEVLPWPRARRRRIRVGDALSAAAAAGAVIVALAVLVLLGGGGGGHPAFTATATHRDPLTATLAVLRRPQTGQDRRGLAQSGVLRLPGSALAGGRVDVASARVAATTSWGSAVLLFRTVPRATAVTAGSVGTGRLALAADHRMMCCATRQRVEAGRAWLMTGIGRQGGRATPARFYLVVPDGVTRVLVLFGEGASRSSVGAVVTVHGNLAALSLNGLPDQPPAAMTWLDRHGTQLRKFSFAPG